MNTTFLKTMDTPPYCEKDALRYAGCRSDDAHIADMLRDCMQAVRSELTYKVCYQELPVRIDGTCCDFGFFQVSSAQLAKNLHGCTQVLLLAATIGLGMDRWIAKYSRISPARAVLMQALGTERIESLCDLFCEQYAREHGVLLRPRFSPGYGDLPLDVQKVILSTLDCSRKIGVFLNDSFLMSPSKSVTAFAGITESASPLPAPDQ